MSSSNSRLLSSADGGTDAEMTSGGQSSSQLSDEALVVGVVQGDVAAFATLYDRYARPIYILAVYMLGSVEAEEAVQELFLRLWHKAGQFDARRGSFSPWFMSMARHYMRDQLRRRGLQQRVMAVEQIDQLLVEAPDPTADVEKEIWQRERGVALLSALKTLPAEQRRAITLAYFGGLSQSSIAESLGWPLGTVKKRIRLGLQKLRAFLSPQVEVVETPPVSVSTRRESE